MLWSRTTIRVRDRVVCTCLHSVMGMLTSMWSGCADPMFTSLRTVETTPNPDGSATAHVVIRCTLSDIARATNLRVEDAAFALNECGLLIRRQEADGPGGTEDVVAVSREMVETVAKQRNVKKMCMSLAHVLL